MILHCNGWGCERQSLRNVGNSSGLGCRVCEERRSEVTRLNWIPIGMHVPGASGLAACHQSRRQVAWAILSPQRPQANKLQLTSYRTKTRHHTKPQRGWGSIGTLESARSERLRLARSSISRAPMHMYMYQCITFGHGPPPPVVSPISSGFASPPSRLVGLASLSSYLSMQTVSCLRATPNSLGRHA